MRLACVVFRSRRTGWWRKASSLALQYIRMAVDTGSLLLWCLLLQRGQRVLVVRVGLHAAVCNGSTCTGSVHVRRPLERRGFRPVYLNLE